MTGLDSRGILGETETSVRPAQPVTTSNPPCLCDTA